MTFKVDGNFGGSFDNEAFKKAKELLKSNGNTKPTSEEIKKAMDKLSANEKPKADADLKIKGFHFEHPDDNTFVDFNDGATKIHKKPIKDAKTYALGENGSNDKITSASLKEEGGSSMTTKALGEEGGNDKITSASLKEEGGSSMTTKALGEEGGSTLTYALGENGDSGMTTKALGEEGGSTVTTDALGEEGGSGETTKALGEEGGSTVTTDALGEEGGSGETTKALGEEGGSTLTYSLGENGGSATTMALGEEGGSTLTYSLGENGDSATTMALGEEGGGHIGGSHITYALGENGDSPIKLTDEMKKKIQEAIQALRNRQNENTAKPLTRESIQEILDSMQTTTKSMHEEGGNANWHSQILEEYIRQYKPEIE